jgi:hypothetical protein
MIQGVFQGRAASDPALGGPLAECLDGLVVDRGPEPKPVREPLPLRLPQNPDEAGEGTDQSGESAGGAPVNGVVSGHQHPHRAEPPPRRRGA